MKSLIALSLLFVLVFHFSAFAKGQEGRGGKTVDVNGNPALKDLVDKTVCVWQPSDHFISTVSYYPTMLKGLSGNDWRFAQAIDAEVRSLSICLTDGPFQIIPDPETIGVTIYLDGTKQVAIRINDQVYIDQTIYKNMTARDQAYLMLHESMHSFVRDVPNRMIKLRSFVRYIADHEKDPVTLADFSYQADKDDVVLPLLNPTIEALRPQFEILLDPSADLEKREIALSVISDIDPTKNGMESLIDYGDASVVSPVRDDINARLNKILKDDDAQALQKLLDGGFNLNTNAYVGGLAEESSATLFYVIGTADLCKDLKSFELLIARPDTDINQRPYNFSNEGIFDYIIWRFSQANCSTEVQLLLKRPDFKLSATPYTLDREIKVAFDAKATDVFDFLASLATNDTLQDLFNSVDVGTTYPLGPTFYDLLNMKDATGKYRVVVKDAYGDLVLAMFYGNQDAFKAILSRPDLKIVGPLMDMAGTEGSIEDQELLLADPSVDVNEKGRTDQVCVNSLSCDGIWVNSALEHEIVRAGVQGQNSIPLLQHYLAHPGIDLTGSLQVAKAAKDQANKSQKDLYKTIIQMLKDAGAK